MLLDLFQIRERMRLQLDPFNCDANSGLYCKVSEVYGKRHACESAFAFDPTSTWLLRLIF